MKLIANCQLMGEYGMVSFGDVFDVRDEIGEQLIKNGNARRIDTPTIVYETQALRPQETPEVRPSHPFRDVHLSDPKPEGVVAPSDPIVSKPDVSTKRTADRRRRNSGKRPAATRRRKTKTDPSE